MHGSGKLFYQSGSLAYDGEWFRDKMQGFGHLNNQHPAFVKKVNFKNFNITANAWQKYEGNS